MKLKQLSIILVLLLLVVGAVWAVVYVREENTHQSTSGPECNYNDTSKSYIHQTPNCPINFLCTVGNVPFSDACGCGCEPNTTVSTNVSDAKTYCTPEQKSADVCFELYQPVCGWSSNDTQTDTYVNSCFACKEQPVAYWTAGDCSSN